MSDSVIEEYLVSLGFKFDSAGKQRFDAALDSTAKMAAGLAVGLAAAATAVAAATVKIASGLDTLFFTAQRAGTSVKNLEAFAYGIEQVGGSAEQAKAAVGGFFEKLRSDPGVEKMLQFKFGVETRDANGGLRDPHDTMMAFVEKLRQQFGNQKYGYGIAQQFAAQAGMSSGDFALFYNNLDKIKQAEAEQRRMTGRFGVDPDKAAEKANQLMTRLRKMQMEIAAIIDKLAQDLGDKLIGYIDRFSQWLDQHQGDIETFVSNVADGLAGAADDIAALVKNLKPLTDGFAAFSQQIFGKSGLNVAFDALLAVVAGSWLTKMLGVADKLSVRFLALAAVLAWMYSESQISAEDKLKRGQANSNWFDNTWFGKGWTTFRDGARKVLGLPPVGGGSGGPVKSLGTAEQKANATESFSFWRSKGFTDEQAAGMVANEVAESQTNPNAVGDGGQAKGIFQHHPDRRANILAGTGIDMATASHAKQLEGAWWELNNTETNALQKILQANTAEAAGAIVSLFFERPRGGVSEANDRGRSAAKLIDELRNAAPPSVPTISEPGLDPLSPQQQWARQRDGILRRNNMLSRDLTGASTPLIPRGMPLPGSASSTGFNQVNNINITGAGDPRETAAHLESVRRRVDQQLIANVKTAVQ